MRLSRDEQDEKDEMDYRDDVQRTLDDEVEAKRAAFGLSPEQLSIQDAYAEGARAGTNGVRAGANPWKDIHCPQYAAWERGRAAAEVHYTDRYAKRKTA